MNPFRRVITTAYAVFFVMMCAGFSYSAEWKFYYQSTTEQNGKEVTQKLYYDEASITRPERNIVRVMQKTSKALGDEKEADIIMRLTEINCSSRTYRYISTTEFEEETGKMVSEEKDAGAAWTRLSLNTSIGGLYDNVCYEKKKPKETEKKGK